MKLIAGVDEVGRGCLAGPVFAAAVILNKNINTKEIIDSKKISFKKRILVSEYIKKNSTVSMTTLGGYGGPSWPSNIIMRKIYISFSRLSSRKSNFSAGSNKVRPN